MTISALNFPLSLHILTEFSPPHPSFQTILGPCNRPPDITAVALEGAPVAVPVCPPFRRLCGGGRQSAGDSAGLAPQSELKSGSSSGAGEPPPADAAEPESEERRRLPGAGRSEAPLSCGRGAGRGESDEARGGVRATRRGEG